MYTFAKAKKRGSRNLKSTATHPKFHTAYAVLLFAVFAISQTLFGFAKWDSISTSNDGFIHTGLDLIQTDHQHHQFPSHFPFESATEENETFEVSDEFRDFIESYCLGLKGGKPHENLLFSLQETKYVVRLSILQSRETTPLYILYHNLKNPLS